MKGIILAAGRGSRMGSLTQKLPKCRTVFNGKELIQWQLGALRDAGIEEIAIVRGYLKETFTLDLTYFDNSRWNDTNMVRSLIAAEEWLTNRSCIISYSDIVYSSDAVTRLINADGDIVISYDPNWEQLWKMRFTNPLSDAETFKTTNDNVLLDIGRRANSINEIKGQYMGLFKFTQNGWSQIIKGLSDVSDNELDKMDMTTMLNRLINKGTIINTCPIDDDWFEIDTENDLNVYHELLKN